MKFPIFEYPSFQYQISNWESKKKKILNQLEKQKFIRTNLQNFETDRQTSNNSYLKQFVDIIRPELEKFCEEIKVNCTVTDCWTVKYKQGDDQYVHNHRSRGFSGVLYLEYDPEVHKPTHFIAPWQDPITDETTFGYFKNIKEGTVVIVPSYTLHYVPQNKSTKTRTVISFDILADVNKI